ncbi:DUF2878 family protein [bacterium]|nr:DUF2878 family protein [bacterium]
MKRSLAIACILTLSCLGMALTWQSWLVYPVLLGGLVAMLAVSREKLDVAFYLLGLTLGAAIDVGQTASGVTVYAAPAWLLFLPGFVFLYWALAGIALRHLSRVLPPIQPHPADVALFVGVIGLSLAANLSPWRVAALMLVALTIRCRFIRHPGDGIAALAGIALGPGLESLLLSRGLYHFPSAGSGLIPLWLVVLYACIGVSARSFVAYAEAAVRRLSGPGRYLALQAPWRRLGPSRGSQRGSRGSDAGPGRS